MLGFDSTPRSIDWSYYGGAEELPPSMRRRKTNDTVISTASSSSAAESSSMASSSSASADSPATSDDEGQQNISEKDTNSTARAGDKWAPAYSSKSPADASDFLWLLTEEPHRTRRMAILKAHPQVRTLMGHEPLTKYISAAVVLLQLTMAVTLAYMQVHPLNWKFLLLAYAVGGTANQNIFLAIHEITHNLAFKGIRANKLWAIFVNAPIGVPYAMMFKRYHIEHHKYLGEDGIDTDLPTKLELICLRNVLGKAFFATFQIFFYALRPGFVRSQTLTGYHLLNFVFQIAVVDFLLVKYVGWTALIYLIQSSFFAGSLHPCAAHFIAEHYMFGGIQQETWSYYGPLNILAYNVGYHNEHHDFPSVPWTRLPALRKMAPEFYDVLPHHTSWPLVTLQFIFGEDSGLFARIKRHNTKSQSQQQQNQHHQPQELATTEGEGNALE
jgi:sphingolipid delta-4 desaturase